MILAIQQGLRDDGFEVALSKLCRWFNVPRRTVYYRSVKSAPKLDPKLTEPIKAMIEESPSFGDRTVAHLLGFNKNTVQRIFQLKGWQVKKRPIGFRPRIEALPSVAKAPDERWSTDLCRIWAGRDRWATLAGDRLPYPRVAGLASVPKRQCNDGQQCAGARPDHALRHAGPGAGPVPVAL